MKPRFALDTIDHLVEAFDAKCQADQYTDIGDAWDIFNAIRKIIATTKGEPDAKDNV